MPFLCAESSLNDRLVRVRRRPSRFLQDGMQDDDSEDEELQPSGNGATAMNRIKL